MAAQMLAAVLNSINQWEKKAINKNTSSKRKQEKTHQSFHLHAIQSADPARSCSAARMNANCLGTAQLPALKNISHQQFSSQKPSSFPLDPGSLANNLASDESLSNFIDSWTHGGHENKHALYGSSDSEIVPMAPFDYDVSGEVDKSLGMYHQIVQSRKGAAHL